MEAKVKIVVGTAEALGETIATTTAMAATDLHHAAAHLHDRPTGKTTGMTAGMRREGVTMTETVAVLAAETDLPHLVEEVTERPLKIHAQVAASNTEEAEEARHRLRDVLT